MSKHLIVIVLSCVACMTAGAANLMVQPTFLATFQDTSSWDLNAGVGDYSVSSATQNWQLAGTAGTMIPAHAAGFVGNGTTGGLTYHNYDWSFSGRPANSIIDVASFTAGVWAKLDTVGQGVQQILQLQGSYTSEYLKIDYSANTENRARIMWSGGQGGDPAYAWETGPLSSYGSWFYFAASYVKGSGSGPDSLTAYVFDSVGNLISGTNAGYGYWIGGASPTGPLCLDGTFDLRGGILVGTNHPAVALSPLSVDEVNIQGYLSQSQIQSQVNLMIAGEGLTIVPEPLSLVLFALGGLLIRNRRCS